ncbi:uncharacterized protein LOC131217437 [Magnolia sinica]|uniref:uncharacterized protein LOC131217437 n=1 Tax=Magnolia sinica TaxID=86752 RepID=UPI0026597162|nr:uncharacterized protein LOC131217437 [Magnolia sinica]
MEFFKVKFKKSQKLNEEKDPESKEAPREESRNLNGDDFPKANAADLPKANAADSAGEIEEDDDDDDFITNEVKRRIKELRNKSFMVLIPEESSPEDEEEEEEETSSSGWRESEAEDRYPWCGFDTFYDKYCERMLFFDKMSARLLQEAGSWNPSTPSPRSASKKLASTLRSLSFKKREDLQEDSEHLQQLQDDPYQDIETAYVAQICLTWEALHCQYMQLSQKISSQPENPASYGHAAQKFQQFQVLLQRFIENEPFEQGHRAEIYARTRNSLPMLLQVPSFLGSDQKEQEEEDSGMLVLANDLIKVIENSIMTFLLFLKSDKKNSGGVLNLFRGNNQAENSLQQIQASLDKKEVKLKELRRKNKGRKKKSWPTTLEQVELLFGLIDVKVVSRVLRMVKISKEQLLWCEEKMSKIDVSESKLLRDVSPVLFPC